MTKRPRIRFERVDIQILYIIKLFEYSANVESGQRAVPAQLEIVDSAHGGAQQQDVRFLRRTSRWNRARRRRRWTWRMSPSTSTKGGPPCSSECAEIPRKMPRLRLCDLEGALVDKKVEKSLARICDTSPSLAAITFGDFVGPGRAAPDGLA
jgi:hypothetical protein